MRLADAEQMRVDRDRRLAEGDVEHDVGGLAPDARAALSSASRSSRHLAAMTLRSACWLSARTFLALLRNRPMVLMCSLDPLLAQRHHLLPACRRSCEQRLGGLVDAGVGRLRRKHHGHQQREGIDVVELALGLGVRCRESGEDRLDIGFGRRFTFCVAPFSVVRNLRL